MKKAFIISVLTILIWPSVSQAEIKINWGNITNPIFQADGVTLAPTSYFAQLIYSTTENVYSSVNPSNPLAVDSGFEIISSQALPFNGYIFQYPASTSNNALLNGWVYTRVFSSQTPDINSMYGQSTNFTQLTSIYSAQNPTGTTITHDPLGIVTSLAIPEPGTLATIAGGLAVVVFGLRRRRYRI